MALLYPGNNTASKKTGNKRKILFLGLLLLLTTGIANAQRLPDLSGIKDLQTLKQTATQLEKDKKDNFHTETYTYLDSALWNGILVQKVALYKDNIEMTIGSGINNGTQKAISFLQSVYKNEWEADKDRYDKIFSVNNNKVAIQLKTEIDQESTVQANTASTLTIRFKPVYAQAYPNIEAKIPKNPDGTFYFLNLSFFNNNVDVWLNGIHIYRGTGAYQYHNEERINLNPFLLGKGNADIKIIITPGLNEDGKPFAHIQKRSFASGALQQGVFKGGEFEVIQTTKFCDFEEYVTDTLVKDGHTQHSSYPGTYHYGGKELTCSRSFSAELPYTLKGWRNGAVMQNDKKLKEKIIALYEKLGRTITAKDAEGMSDLFYEMGEECVIARYNQNSNLIDTWTRWMSMFAFTNIIKPEHDFDILLSEDGKLVYALPKTQPDMLRAIGKQAAEGFTQYMYEDATTHELKFIR